MKIQTKSWLKSLVSLALCLSMVLCTPLMAFAEEIDEQANDKKADIIYVSIGDSMTNGYCLDGYDGESGALNYAINTYSNKFAAYLAGDTDPIEDDQVIFDGTDDGKNGRIVDHRQLAISGLRSQDIQWILELDYTNENLLKTVYDSNNIGFNNGTWYSWGFSGDYYTWDDFCDYKYRYADAAARVLAVYDNETNAADKYFNSSYASKTEITNAIKGIKADPYYPENNQVNEIGEYKYLQIATEFYQKSVADADIISLAVGNTNFGTHMLSNIMDVIMAGDTTFSNQYTIENVMKLVEKDDLAKHYVNKMLNSDDYATMMAYCKGLSQNSNYQAEIEKIVKYCTIAYITGYVGMLNAILGANPDVEIIQLPLMNAYKEKNGEVADGTLGKLVEIIYNPVNKILKDITEDFKDKDEYKDAKFYFAEDCHVSCMVDVYGDDFYLEAETYPGLLNGTEDFTPNTKSIVRDRFVEEIVCGEMIFAAMGMAKPNNSETVRKFLYGDPTNNLCGVVAYDMMTYTEKAAFAATNADVAKEYAIYLAFENAIIRSGKENITMESLGTIPTIGSKFQTYLPVVYAAIDAASVNYFDEAASVIVANSDGALTTDNVLDILGAVETIKTTIWNSDIVKPHHESLKTYTEHTSVDDILECEHCTVKKDGHYTYFAQLIDGILYNYKEQMDLLPYNIIAEIGKDQIGDLLSAKDIQFICEEKDYKIAVYTIIKNKAENNYGFEMSDNDIDSLIASEDYVFNIASMAVGGQYSASDIKMAYNMNIMLTPEQRAQIDNLKSLRLGIIELLGKEQTFKGYANPLKDNIPVIVESVPLLAYLLALPQAMSDSLLDDSNIQGALCMNARVLLGTGAGGHPSTIGHETLYNTIIDVFDYTVSYEWSEDFAKCTATRTTKNNGKVVETKNVDATSAVTKEANCKETGVKTYTAVFNEYWAATQTETEEIPVTDHDYTKFTDPAWTWTENYEASAVFTCPDCEKEIDVTDDVTVSGETVTEADCRNEGKYIYTATVEFNGKTYTSTKDKVLEKIEHNYGEDGRCQNTLTDGTVCGEYNLAQYGQCTPTVSAELVSGSTLTMLLDGNNVGEFTFTETESGWTIANAEGKYLASDANGNLVLSDSAYGWNYSDGKFSTTVKVPGTSWIEQLLGLTKDATYYLAYSEEAVVVASSGSAVTFSTTKDNGYHTFGEINVVDPTCTEKGYTERTCSVCGEVFKTNEVEELGHTYEDTVFKPTCGVDGYTEFTCTVCGDKFTEEDEGSALEHDFSENDTCSHCGISDVAVYGECEFKTEASLSDGTYTLSLGGTDVGVYTFSAVSGGYTIKDSDGKYLSVDSNGNLVRSESEFTWTYSNGKFSASVGKASTNWLEILFGGNKKTTYYLAASGSDVTVSTTGAEAKFYIAGKAETHTFEEAYVEPECGVDGYTEFTCTVCGDKFTKEDEGSALEHDYVLTGTVEVTCLTDGYSVYTCSKCGDTYNDDFVTASGSHNFGEDGTCQNVLPNGVCGEPDEPECVYDKEQTLVSGNTYEMTLGGKSVGEYTFNSVEGGWSIMNSDGKYLALEDGKLVVSDSAFAWTYSNGRFSSSSSSGTTGMSWIEILFGIGNKSSTYYLVSSGNTVTVSTSNSSASAKFIAKVTGEHNYSKAKPVDGNHVSVCSNCGYEKTEICNDDNCVLCNASVNVSVSVTKSEPTHWLEILLGGGSSSYKASITTVANGTEVDSVEYSLNGTTWTKGTSFTSKTEISSFSIRVNADNGLTYNYIYSNGSVEFVG